MTARFLIGPGQAFAPSPIPSRTTTVVTQSKLKALPVSGTLRVLPVEIQPPSTTRIDAEPQVEPKVMGKETKAANIAGVIKSKTADFEKIAKQAQVSSGGPTIAQTLRLRSQGNIQLKQEFLLRQQQQQHLPSRTGPAPSRPVSADRHRPLIRKKPETQNPSPTTPTEPSPAQTPGRYKRSELISSRQVGEGSGGNDKQPRH